MTEHYDVIIVGGGIVGLATASFFSDQKVLVLEKESNVAQHQSGRNSGVIHSGIYYKPGSVKAETCRRGKKMLEAFCEANQIPVRRCGKVVVATSPDERERLLKLLDRGFQNGVDCELIGKKQLKKLEPHVEANLAITVPETGIVDFKLVCEKLKEQTQVKTCQKVVSVSQNNNFIEVSTNDSKFSCDRLINCGGLYADKIAQMCGVKSDIQIIPFRGIYYTLKESSRHLCRSLVYPVPDPQFPFLGVHFTSTIDGGVEVGPNAVLALGRESYSIWDIDFKETVEIFSFSGARKLFKKHWKMGLKEMMISFSKTRYVKELRKLIPEINVDDLLPRVSGIRAQAVDRDGNLVDDFCIIRDNKILHVLNAPSPAATAAFAIAEKIANSFV